MSDEIQKEQVNGFAEIPAPDREKEHFTDRQKVSDKIFQPNKDQKTILGVTMSKIGSLIGALSGIVTGHYQTTIAGILQYVFSMTTIPGTVQASISTVITAIAIAAMNKKDVWSQLMASGAALFTVLQWVGTILPPGSLPLHTAYAAIMAAFMVFMKAEGVDLNAAAQSN